MILINQTRATKNGLLYITPHLTLRSYTLPTDLPTHKIAKRKHFSKNRGRIHDWICHRLSITNHNRARTHDRIYDLTIGCDSDVGDDLKEGAERESISGVINAVGDIGVG